MIQYAFCVPTQTHIEPFSMRVGDVPVLDVVLSTYQKNTLQQEKITLIQLMDQDKIEKNTKILVYSDKTWFTVCLLQRLIEHFQKTGMVGTVCCDSTDWNENMRSCVQGETYFSLGIITLSDLIEWSKTDFAENYWQSLPEILFDWQLELAKPLELHPSMQHAVKPMPMGACMVYTVGHWIDVLRVNQLALLEKAERVKWAWKHGTVWSKITMVLGFIWKVRSLSPQTIARRIGTIGKNCKIHPTAVIEACEIGNNVEIGPFAVLRASVVLDGAKIEEHATVNLSIIGSKARVARYAMINLSVLMEEAFVSRGGGFQMCLFGKQSFVAVDAVMLDLSFGKTIQVEYQGKWIDSKEYFVGVCVGHKAVVGNAVRLNYGVSIPNEALLVANADALICDASAAEPQLPYRAKDKKVVRIVSTKQ